MTNDKCANCGGDRGIHHYQTDQCPVGGVEAPIDREQEYKTSTFLAMPQSNIADDTAHPFICDGYVSGGLTKREYFAAMAMQGMLASNRDEGEFTFELLVGDSVTAADALIEALNEENGNGRVK